MELLTAICMAVAFKQEMLCVDFESDVEDDILAIFRKGEVGII